MDKPGYIYILTNPKNSVLYIGVTSNLIQRISTHQSKKVKGFAKKYQCHKLVYYESCGSILNAIQREKQLKAGPRAKKLQLINDLNPGWEDLSRKI